MTVGLNLTIKVTRDEATPAVRRLMGSLDSHDMRDAMGRGSALVVRNHLDDLDRTRAHTGGGRRSHMYANASKQTGHTVTDDGMRVTIAHESIALRYYGGTVRPVNAKLLAIPIDPRHPAADPEAADAYGESPRKFHHLRLVMFGKTGRGALFARNRSNIAGGKRKRRTIHGGIFYWLTPEATHRPDPSVLPTDDEIATGAVDAGEDFAEALLEEGAEQ